MVRILLVSFGSEWHNDVWNVLAIESLVGDLEGYFGNNIQISTFRFYTEDDTDSMFSDNSLLDYHRQCDIRSNQEVCKRTVGRIKERR